jgi:hypothetical protein
MLSYFGKLKRSFMAAFSIMPQMAGGPGRFDSTNNYTSGTYDQQTSFGFDKQLAAEVRSKLMFNSMAKTGDEWDDSIAGSPGDLSSGSIVKRVKIVTGDELRFTMDENMTGAPTYGDRQHAAGDFAAYKNMFARLNIINSPAVPIVGEMSQQRIKESISNLDATTKAKVTNWLAQQLDWESHCGLIYGASPSCLTATTSGGLGVSLGVNAGGGAGVPYMNRWWWMGGDGWMAHSRNVATYNGTVNGGINAIGTAAGDYITLAQLKKIRFKMDTEHLWSPTFMGKKYKAVAIIDPELFYRLHSLLAAAGYLYAAPRGMDNPWFNVDTTIVYDGILYVSDPTLYLMRPAYVSTNPTVVPPSFGPDATADFRDYAVTSTTALVVFLGRNAIVEGFNGSVVIKEKWADFDKGVQVAARTMQGAMRGEWYAKDGRTDANSVRNYSVICAAFYEPGVGA